jgi:tetratricopeptide (TPR) repeat protein
MLQRRAEVIVMRPLNIGAFLSLILAAALFAGAYPAVAQDAPSGEIETPGTTPIALVEEAYLAQRKGNYEEAIRVYSRIIQRRGLTKRERAICYLLRGEAKRDSGQLDEGILDFTRAVRQWPSYPQAYYFRGRIYESQGKLVPAYADITRASQLDPDWQPYQQYLTLLKKRMAEAGIEMDTLGVAPEPTSPAVPPDDQPAERTDN